MTKNKKTPIVQNPTAPTLPSMAPNRSTAPPTQPAPRSHPEPRATRASRRALPPKQASHPRPRQTITTRTALIALLAASLFTAAACQVNTSPELDSCEEALQHTVALTIDDDTPDVDIHRAQVATAARPSFDTHCRALSTRAQKQFTDCVLTSTTPAKAASCR